MPRPQHLVCSKVRQVIQRAFRSDADGRRLFLDRVGQLPACIEGFQRSLLDGPLAGFDKNHDSISH